MKSFFYLQHFVGNNYDEPFKAMVLQKLAVFQNNLPHLVHARKEELFIANFNGNARIVENAKKAEYLKLLNNTFET